MSKVSQRVRWRNGGGWTQVLAQAPGPEPVEWRISVADIERDGPFSDYSGYDRTIVAENAGFTLEFADGERAYVSALEPFSFSGDRAVYCRLDGAAVTAFNVMTLRTAFRHDVRVTNGEIEIRIFEGVTTMQALDLTKTPPRSPYVELGGLLMLARTIDKIRATLDGGNLGAYQIAGFSQRLLDALEIHEDDLRAVIALASSDDEVVAWVRKHTDPSKYAQINEMLERPTVGERLDRPDMVAKYPVLKTLPPELPLLRMLDADDAQSFGA